MRVENGFVISVYCYFSVGERCWKDFSKSITEGEQTSVQYPAIEIDQAKQNFNMRKS